jgi:hypothetical protein
MNEQNWNGAEEVIEPEVSTELSISIDTFDRGKPKGIDVFW